jgi:PAS domain S-box-containing protein
MYCRIVGYSQSELQRISFRDLTHPDDREHDWHVFSRAARGDTPLYSNDKRYVRSDGRIIWVRLNASFVRDSSGRAIRSVAVCEDITDRLASERRIGDLLAEKETLLREVQHRVKNTMHTMGSLLHMEAGRLSDPNAVAALNDMEGRFTSMEVLYEQLYRSESSGTVAVREYLSSLVRSVADIFPRSETVAVKIEIDEFTLDAKRLSALGMIVNELVTNAMKYAFATRTGGRLGVSGRTDGRRITVTVSDDGHGLPDHVARDGGGSFGMTMVRALVEQLSGTLRFEGDRGVRAVVEFPVDAGRAPDDPRGNQ